MRRNILDFNIDLGSEGKIKILDSSDTNFKIPIDCSALVMENLKITQLKNALKQNKNRKRHLTIFLIKSIEDKVKKYLDKNKLIYFDEEKICFESKRFNPLQFLKKDINGMIVEVKPPYFENIGSKKSFVYFKGKRIGHHLKKGDFIFLFVLPSKNNLKGEILGFGTLKKKPSIGDSQIAWKKYQKKVLLSKEDFNQFTQNKKKIMSMEIQNFKLIPSIGYDRLKGLLNLECEPEDFHQQYLSKKNIHVITRSPAEGGSIIWKNENMETIISDFVKYSKKNNKSSFWAKSKKLKSEPENIAKNLLDAYLTPRYITYKEVSAGDGFVDILARKKNENSKHTLIELKVNKGPRYVQAGINRFKRYIDDLSYELEKKVYYIIYDFTAKYTSKVFNKKKLKHKGYSIKILIIHLPK